MDTIAKRPRAVIEEALMNLVAEDRMSPDLVFRGPYILDFLGMPSDFSESDLEAALLREIELFLLELGSGFSFVARPKRLSIGPADDYLDLLFFHTPLRALVAIELNLGRFDARDKGQMDLYLRWLDRHKLQPGENPPLGLILCADKNQEQIELPELNKGSLRVASYPTKLPPRAHTRKEASREYRARPCPRNDRIAKQQGRTSVSRAKVLPTVSAKSHLEHFALTNFKMLSLAGAAVLP